MNPFIFNMYHSHGYWLVTWLRYRGLQTEVHLLVSFSWNDSVMFSIRCKLILHVHTLSLCVKEWNGCSSKERKVWKALWVKITSKEWMLVLLRDLLVDRYFVSNCSTVNFVENQLMHQNRNLLQIVCLHYWINFHSVWNDCHFVFEWFKY